ncbi:MAG: hypothetical protein ABF449_01585 [Ethanoligenens sp.]|uniref:hypothetical protein n=1 Tax=Ethanoligenens sp. TaxID=2099655 RepID=UPI0039EA836C
MNRLFNRIKTFFARHAGYAIFFIVGLAVLVGAETGVLVYLNNVYLHESDHYKVTRLTSSASAVQKRHALTLDVGAQNVSVSHDGNYLAYLENGSIHVVDMNTGQSTAVPAVPNRSVAYFEWVYDRDRLTIVEKNTTLRDDGTDTSSAKKSGGTSRSDSSDKSSDYFAELYSFDMSDKTITLVRDYMNNHDVLISLNSAGDTISDMDMSTETVVTYLKITSASGRDRLWEANITVKNAAISNLPTHDIGRIQSLKSSDDLLYEDKDTGHVYLYDAKKDNSTVFSINNEKNLRLLGFDQNDNQYFGITQNNLITSVVYGNPISQTWQTIALPAPVDPSLISVAYSGAVYVNNKDALTVKELVSGKSAAYTGNVLCIYDSGFYSMDNNSVEDHPIGTTARTSTSSGTASGTSSSQSSSSSASLSLSIASNTSAQYKKPASGSSK